MSALSGAGWVRIYPTMLDDYAIHKLPADEFARKFRACVVEGEENEFSDHIKHGYDRPHHSEWSKLRAAVFERDDYTCRYCGERGGKLECDHVIPVSRGGEHNMDNLATACFTCNRSKRDKTLEEWLGQ